MVASARENACSCMFLPSDSYQVRGHALRCTITLSEDVRSDIAMRGMLSPLTTHSISGGCAAERGMSLSQCGY